MSISIAVEEDLDAAWPSPAEAIRHLFHDERQGRIVRRARDALVEDEARVHVREIIVGNKASGVQLDLGAVVEGAVEHRLAPALQVGDRALQ